MMSIPNGNNTTIPDDWGEVFFEQWKIILANVSCSTDINITTCGKVVKQLVNNWLITGTSIFGLIGNLITGIVLCMPEMRSAYGLLLLALTVSDSLQLLTHLLTFGLPSWGIEVVDKVRNYARAKVIWMVGWTVLVSCERYIAICKPFISRRIYLSRKRTLIYIIVAVTLATLFNLPKWFAQELNTNLKPECKTFFNSTNAIMREKHDATHFCMCPGKSRLHKSPVFRYFYVAWGNVLVNFIIPVVILVVLNSLSYLQLRKAKNGFQKPMTKSQQHDHSITTMLICVVVIFTMCNILFGIDELITLLGGSRPSQTNLKDNDNIVNLNSTLTDEDSNYNSIFFNSTLINQGEKPKGKISKDLPCWVILLKGFKNFLYTFNAAVNFVVYCACGSKFRAQLAELYQCLFKCKGTPKSRDKKARKNYIVSVNSTVTTEYMTRYEV